MKVMGALIAFEDGLQPLANLTGPSVADSLNVAELGGGCRHQGSVSYTHLTLPTID